MAVFKCGRAVNTARVTTDNIVEASNIWRRFAAQSFLEGIPLFQKKEKHFLVTFNFPYIFPGYFLRNYGNQWAIKYFWQGLFK